MSYQATDARPSALSQEQRAQLDQLRDGSPWRSFRLPLVVAVAVYLFLVALVTLNQLRVMI